ncbi:MAG: peptidase M23 [Rhodobacteraceae bacterium CG17_big_fil_post_rev_8_21_14_2_50_65_11]|nr:MAG: peptidase M23 [Rhodobacteraceae bacterium CG17_big_fil_post_rev_8_21_14_2_50_65_11]
MPRFSVILLGLGVPLLAACDQPGAFDFDFRNNGMSGATATATNAETAPRPEADEFGLITYPTYQVVVARRGDSLADVANRIGMDPADLARFNGREASDTLRNGEVLALPRRVTPPGAGSTTDITAIASAAIDRADEDAPAATRSDEPELQVQGGAEPVRHRVARGETAYSVSRLYGVSVRSLAEWNGLGPELTVREGQFLIIPIVLQQAPSDPDGNAPGYSMAPVPPSAADPLPEDIATAELPDAPDMQAETPTPGETAEETAGPQMQRPVPGQIVRPYSGSSEGIDIATDAGTPVRAAANGEVAAITRDTDQVPILVLRHSGNLLTVYANIADIVVERGDTISRGQTIATVGAGDPAFLHFEVRQGFESVDPTPYIE